MAQLVFHKTMTIIDGLKLIGAPAEIPDCSRDDLPGFFLQMGYKDGAEIGVDKGEFSQKFCQAGLQLYAIDPWASYPDYSGPDGNQARFDYLYEYTKAKLAPLPHCHLVRKTSMQAVTDFADNNLDFVYIDANHQLKYVIEDLVEWSKKVRPGGAICGHDYIYTASKTPAGTCHVIYALRAFTQAYHIDNWYLLGRRERRPDETRDRFRSWLIIKP